ncbi:hypothetical protein [Mesorhizobium loti]|uniref:hypothetical protein n=1 Tax=Rhizobium loti TaxID=381 RepID=UPI001495E29D|nr:hypothetical protein [Mesorhizobium loti]
MAGATGNNGPQVTINANTGTYAVGTNRAQAAVVGSSAGSAGSNGSNAYVFGSGGDGGNGANGGQVLVNFEGIIVSGNAGGILAQSLGGNGGNGGDFKGIGGSAGSGGTGGNGGSATASFNGGSLVTTGQGNIGVSAFSQGGNGGNAGHGGGAVFVTGDGGGAAQAGSAFAQTLAGTSITTSGDYGFGIAARSMGGGGGGGQGGFGLFYSGASNGSTGGAGGNATVNANGSIDTFGDYAYGIIAQSIGGGGGDGGTAAGAVALGGSGSGGGGGGTVSVTNAGNITTRGLGANVIIAQSIGGGGGNGGSSGGAISFGGDGSGTTTGGNVSVTNTGTLKSYSSLANGILAQSIGGGGGNGGSSGGLFAYGGSGGDAADAGTVTVTNGGSIETGINAGSKSSVGILAQSIGGGGGNGGNAVAVSPVAVAVGGNGGMAGNGNSVKVLRDNINASQASSYDITTHGDTSSAIIAQSVGGGGGNGGFAVAGSVGIGLPFNLSVGVGGGGNAGGNAADVLVQTKGSINTGGISSSGILAQSIGGGGGSGGTAVAAGVGTGIAVSVGVGGNGGKGGNASTVDVDSLSDISTTGNNSLGISAQSIGGGGGNGGLAVAGSIGAATINVGVGGSGATGGTAAAVTVKSSGSVHTAGDDSIAVLGQSIGGGGGNGGNSVAGGLSASISANVAVGGTGGKGQNAGSVLVTTDGAGHNLSVSGYAGNWNTVTTGKNSSGIVAQSLGGGGGNGGFAGSLSLGGGAAFGLSLGGSGNGGGNASTAYVESGWNGSPVDNIFTLGDNSSGVVAQSIGGGGGNGGFSGSLAGGFGSGSVAVTLGGQGGYGGTAANAHAYSNGNITTVGNLSNAIIVQSIGGGGGNGGVSVALSGSAGFSGSAAVGGNGGAASNGAQAELKSIGNIVTYGQQSNGLVAQSIGGGGGNGGFAGSGALGSAGAAAVGVGGKGAGGGNADIVKVTNNGNITTYGSQSSGIVAQSLGGGGGNGGSTVGFAAGGGGSVGVAVGGSAAGGGNASSVTVDSVGNIATGNRDSSLNILTGNNSYGILAQSIGGGGGNGGFAGSLSAGGALGIGVSVGGTGGQGGTAGRVDVTNAGNISTLYDNSSGILAQSIGGGGGNGGFAVSAALSASIEDIGAAAAVSVGGKGGNGQKAGIANAKNTGTIFTAGSNSNGVAAQSIGGGGGNGGFSAAAAVNIGPAGIGVSVGGFSGTGGDASSVKAEAYALDHLGSDNNIKNPSPTSIQDGGQITLETDGNNSNGVLAQSIGGGGGNGGFSVAAGVSATGAGIGVSIGGFGSAGGKGGDAEADSSHNILTKGNNSNGVLAQSIGGGGGNGGFSAGFAGGAEFGGSASVGGFGSEGGDAMSATVNAYGETFTKGNDSNGILAQSIGGGGGNGGFSVSGAFGGTVGVGVSVGGFGAGGGNADKVTVTTGYDYSNNAITKTTYNTVQGWTYETLGDRSNGILAQSLGGGGGNGGFSVAGGVGGDGGVGVSVGGFALSGGGDASTVDVFSDQNIHTKGSFANAILAQSIGGGGGNGGFSGALGAGSQIGGSASVGGFGSTGGKAEKVTVHSLGQILTEGNDSRGVVAQSLGGGGGNGGFSISAGGSLEAPAVGLSVGGFGAGGGNGGDVSVTEYGVATNDSPDASSVLSNFGYRIETHGDRSDGLLAQSIGGGGGNGGFSAAVTFADASAGISASVGGFGGGAGTGGNVDVTSVQNYYTKGNFSNGISAQSIGGGGGNGGFSLAAAAGGEFAGAFSVGGIGAGGGDAGTVTVNSTGRFLTEGTQSNGILAQSIGGGGGNGGASLSGTFTIGTAGISASVGGFGGKGGKGNAVVVNNNVGQTITGVSIETKGQSSNGIEAQSIGGKGGNGGFSGSLAGSIESKATLALSVGGFGGTGNTASSVDVTSVDNILTHGDGSNGILAQSIGGGGGDGGFSFAGTITGDSKGLSLAASLGGFGGSGNDAGAVTVNSTGDITTEGNHAVGILAQSIGSGGGNGGISVAATLDLCTDCQTSVAIGASSGGAGGNGGKAVKVDVTHVGDIKTLGDGSDGIMAQSIGGSGGNGGLSVTGGFSGADGKQIKASVGGFGGAGSQSGEVVVNNTGNITTGSRTTIELAQQLSSLTGLHVTNDTLTAFGLPTTVQVVTGRDASGILAQSIGGGGGNGGLAISGAVGFISEKTSLNMGLTMGGFGGSGGFSDKVSVTNDGAIETYGPAAHGILAQSIGGGGGNGGGAVTGLLTAGNAETGRPVNVAVSVGGLGGDGNYSGAVFVEQTGGIITHGVGSNGIFAQSIGGGGGNGGNANTISLQAGSACTFDPLAIVDVHLIKSCKSPEKGTEGVNVQVNVGGFGGSGNDANTVTVINHSFITTMDMMSSGIVAQSIGGGGGSGGNAIVGTDGLYANPLPIPLNPTDIAIIAGTTFNSTSGFVQSLGNVAIGGTGGSAGDAKAVSVTNEGAITTSGAFFSHGIMAQSIGGGGGDGGKSAAGLFGLVSLGGMGNAAGDGGTVDVENKVGADIWTKGAFSDGILAQSIGGGGGDGGAAGGLIAVGGNVLSKSGGEVKGNGDYTHVVNAAHIETDGLFSNGIVAQSLGGGGGNGGAVGLTGITVGGWGGSAGTGGEVKVENTTGSTILTKGFVSYGILAQSIGGGGGNGGSNTLAAAVAIGGGGGSSGKGGHVTVLNDGMIETQALGSIGIYAQSVGGSGGTGGSTFLSAVSVGGAGGASGDGGQVDVTNTAQVKTAGAGADAIRAQSIGGGGGAAGGKGADTGAMTVGASLLVSVGGAGGNAGTGGAVNVTNSGLLLTSGDKADGIYAQSVGGGGGEGGNAYGMVAVGGGGGSTGAGGTVTVTNNKGGQIWTKGILSNAIFAQSIGGGGGNGGAAYAGSPIGVSNSVGGKGATGGDGGAVIVDNYDMLQTDGASSQAIFAQSVGGGGGNGANAGSFSIQAVPILPAEGVTVGGSGGAGGNGGTVTVTNHADASIVTNAANSTAIFAQSVGGGGGNGGSAISVATPLTNPLGVSVTLGGNGGAAGDGSDVKVTNDGMIVLNGENSLGIMAQSVGGGGGTAASALGISEVPIAIGGDTGAEGKGGAVTVSNTGSITINGDNSIGIFAQSVGGGGGLVKAGGGAGAVESQSGGTGNGGIVTVTNTAGSIIMNGDNAIAIYSQSVGGGGGAVGVSETQAPQMFARLFAQPQTFGALRFSSSAGGAGLAAATIFNQTGNLIATGNNSIAMLAQSSAADGNGDITVNIFNPSATTTSLIVGGLGNGTGLQILDGATNTVNNDGVVTAVEKVTGDFVSVDAINATLSYLAPNATTAQTVSGINGYAIRGTGGDDAIENAGLVMGSVDLQDGDNSFHNQAKGVFDLGVNVDLGGGLYSNDGLSSLGGLNFVQTTQLTGDFTQSAVGIHAVDLDLASITADRLNLTGSASVAGDISINLLNPAINAAKAKPGTHEITIVSADLGETHHGINLVAPNTAVATYALTYPAVPDTDIDISYRIDYSPQGLTDNQHSVGNAVNMIQTDQTSPAFAPIATLLFFQPDTAALGKAYDSLSGSGTSGFQQMTFDANDAFLSTVFQRTRGWISNDNAGTTVLQDTASIPLGYFPTKPAKSGAPADIGMPVSSPIYRAWVAAFGGYGESAADAGVGSAASTDRTGGVAVGLDYQPNENWLMGLAAGYGNSSFDTPDRLTSGRSKGDGHFAVYTTYQDNAFYATGSLGLAFYDISTQRAVSIPGVTLQQLGGAVQIPGMSETVDGSFNSRLFSTSLETGYKLTSGAIELTPFAGMQFQSIHSDPYSETVGGAPSALGLSFADRTINSLPGFLGLQVKSQANLTDSVQWAGWVRAAWRHEFLSDRSVDAAFLAAPGYDFVTNGGSVAKDSLRLSLGSKLSLGDSAAIFGNFSGDLSKGVSPTYNGTLGLQVNW